MRIIKTINIPISITKTERLKDNIVLVKPNMKEGFQDKQAEILANYLYDNTPAYFLDKFIEHINAL